MNGLGNSAGALPISNLDLRVMVTQTLLCQVL